MDSVTEVNLDDLDSGLSSVSIEKTEESFNDLSQQNSTDGIEDLDLLVDPNKSRSPVPPQRNDMDNEPLANLPTGSSSPPSIVEKKLDTFHKISFSCARLCVMAHDTHMTLQ